MPASVAMLLEPFLANMGYGNFLIRPSPYCGFATCLVNAPGYQSVPLTRLYNVAELWKELAPLVSKNTALGWFTAAKIRRVRRVCFGARSA